MSLTDDAAFADFVARASFRLLHLGWLLTGDRHQAEDLAQTALLRTYRSWSRVRRDDALAYARRVLVNAHIDQTRRPIRETAQETLPELPDASQLEGLELRDGLSAALAGLTVRERQVVVLRYYLDLSEVQIAERLGIRPGTVKSTAARALARLRVTVTDPSDRPEGADLAH